MAIPPFDFDEANPADSALISQFPSNERASRDNIQDAFEVEHTEAGGRHKFGVGNDAARDAITDWVVGSFWLNTTTTPAALQRVVSIGPVVFETITQISPVTTEGDLIVAGVSGAEARLAIGAAAQYLRADGTTAAWSALLGADLPAASESVLGVAELATAAEMETATDDARIVTPLKANRHPGAAKGWVKFDMSGNILASHNVSSVTDNGLADFTVNWTIAFSSADYVVEAHVLITAFGSLGTNILNQLAGSVEINTVVMANGLKTEAQISAVMVVAYGDQ